MEGCNIMFARIRRWVETTFSRRQKKLLADVLNRLNAAQRELQACREENKTLRERIKALLEQEEPEPPRPTEPRRFNAVDHATKTPSENKQLLEEVLLRDTRKTPREVLGTETFFAHQAPDIGDMDVRAEFQWGINVAVGNDPNQKTGNMDIERCSFTHDGGVDWPSHTGMKWGMRRLDLGDTYVGDCDFFDIPQEHGIYDSLGAHGYYRGCTFKNIGSQAIQFAYRDAPYGQYSPDNDPFTKDPIIVVEDCHVVDSGQQGTRPSFAYTFFDPGTVEHPGTLILRDTTYVCDWDTPRSTYYGDLHSTGGLVVHQYQQLSEDSPATKLVVLTNTLWDATKGDRPIVAIRGTEEIVLHDSCFIARGEHRYPFVDIDGDFDANSSGKVIIDNCVSPGPTPVMLRVRRENICSMHQPGRRVVVDVKSGEIVEEGESQGSPAASIQSPLAFKVGTVPSGVTPQPEGHVDDMP